MQARVVVARDAHYLFPLPCANSAPPLIAFPCFVDGKEEKVAHPNPVVSWGWSLDTLLQYAAGPSPWALCAAVVQHYGSKLLSSELVRDCLKIAARLAAHRLHVHHARREPFPQQFMVAYVWLLHICRHLNIAPSVVYEPDLQELALGPDLRGTRLAPDIHSHVLAFTGQHWWYMGRPVNHRLAAMMQWIHEYGSSQNAF